MVFSLKDLLWLFARHSKQRQAQAEWLGYDDNEGRERIRMQQELRSEIERAKLKQILDRNRIF